MLDSFVRSLQAFFTSNDVPEQETAEIAKPVEPQRQRPNNNNQKKTMRASFRNKNNQQNQNQKKQNDRKSSIPVQVGNLPALIEKELADNEFSQFYTKKKLEYYDSDKDSDDEDEESKSDSMFAAYSHRDAIAFAAASWNWNAESLSGKSSSLKKKVVEVQNFPTSSNEYGTRAYYSVIEQTEEKCVLIACHVNVHGFHRGDLRFVEINHRTVCKDFEECSVIGHLFPGDIVAVTKLRRTSAAPLNPPNVYNVFPDKKCSWEVATMTVMRRALKKVTFAVLPNGMAIAKGCDEPLNVQYRKKQKFCGDDLYTGSAFLPEKLIHNVIGNKKTLRNEFLILKASKIPTFPAPFGTIFEHRFAEVESKFFEIGVNAFKKTDDRRDQIEIVETCTIMGYSASFSVSNGRFDWREHPMKDVRRQGPCLMFSIPNPPSDPTEDRWRCSTRIVIEGKNRNRDNEWIEAKGVVETVIVLPNRRLQIAVRLSRNSPKDVNYSDGVFLIKQRETFEIGPLLDGYFEKLPEYSNGRRIITALYGGERIEKKTWATPKSISFPSTPPVVLNKHQTEYVNMLLAETPIVLGSSPFGCGKSMTIVTAAITIWEERNQKRLATEKNAVSEMQLLVTQSNYASVNLADIAQKCEEHFEREELKGLNCPKFVRYVSEANWKELPDNCRTDYDMPVLARLIFAAWATGELAVELDYNLCELTTKYVLQEKVLRPDELAGAAQKMYKNKLERHWKNEKKKRIVRLPVIAFFMLYRPDIVMTTADTLQGLLSAGVLRAVSHIQIDEASQLPECTLISLLSSCPDACFGMIGDIHQLPPYCEDDLQGRLKDYGIGNTMERALAGNMFPRADLLTVYRCHPKTTSLLSELFYDGRLVSGVSTEMRSEFMTKRPDIWPNAKFPIAIVDNQGASCSMGKSRGNHAETRIVKQIVDELLREHNGYRLRPEDVGVISFYAGQTALLTEEFRGSGVKCGTVDAFQGNEREVIVVCCTNERLSEFMQLSNRINVAMSRARQAMFVIGNVNGLGAAKYWKTIVKKVEAKKCLVDTSRYPFCSKITARRESIEENGERVTIISQLLPNDISKIPNKKKNNKQQHWRKKRAEKKLQEQMKNLSI